MSFNRIILLGHVGRDPELRYSARGTAVCAFPVAVSGRRTDQTGAAREVTTWFRVSVWGRQAEAAAEYLRQGRQVYLEGRLRVEEYTDRDGRRRHSLEVWATDLQFVGTGPGAGAGAGVRRAVMIPEGRPTPRAGDWVLRDGVPVRRAPADAGGTADAYEEEDAPS